MAAQTMLRLESYLLSVVLLRVPQVDKADQRLRKEAQVTLYRNYRVGDFPDIQIPYSSLIAPLQALAQVRLPLLSVSFSQSTPSLNINE